MKTNYGLFFMAFALIAAMLVWSINYEHAPKRKPAKIQITDWDAWHQERMDRLKYHYGNRYNFRDVTADEYLTHIKDNECFWYFDALPINEYHKVMQHFLDEFPLEDLNNRLAYEDRDGMRAKHSAKHKYQLSTTFNQLHNRWNAEYYERMHLPDGQQEVIPYEKSTRRSRRQRALEILHRDRLEAFADQNSFGSLRMPEVDTHDLLFYFEREPTPFIEEQTLGVENQSLASQSLTESEKNELTLFPKRMYRENDLNFSRDFAYVPDFRKARGFIPHSLFRMNIPSSLHLKSLELVSLLKYDVPKVYISDRFPDMKLLANAETRDLDSFETSALEKLFAGEFVVVDESPQHLQVLGAVHAGTTCVECHAVEKGELLGAFSYKFDRTVEWSLTLNP